MNITASLVKELRERTGAGMMECKKALTETKGDMDKAIKLMREKGATKAAKKSSRTAAEGIIVVVKGENGAAILEVNSETDFVARNEEFIGFSNDIAKLALSNKINNLEQLKNQTQEKRLALVGKLGENINIRRFQLILATAPLLETYVHSNRIGVIVALEGGDAQLAKDIAMHVAASHPQVIAPEEVSEELISQEKEIFKKQAQNSGKPDAIIEKMIEGRIKKFMNEISLLGQPFVKDPGKSVEQLLKESNAKVLSFIRYEVGEGIEKKADDFVAEVMAQARG